MTSGATEVVEVPLQARPADEERARLRVCAIQTGHNLGNEPYTRRGMRWSANLRRYRPYPFPVPCYVVEHPEGTMAIDTGSNARVAVSRLQPAAPSARRREARRPAPRPRR